MAATLPAKRIFMQCRSCGRETVFHKKHREALALRLGKNEADLTGKDVRSASASFACKECGGKGVDVREVDRPAARTLYVASGRDPSAWGVFHRDSCGWVGHVHKATAIEFASREDALLSGFKPCRYCRP